MIKKIKKVGSRAEVFHGKAIKTSGCLTKKAFIKNKHGRIVSLKKVKSARYKKTNPLLKLGLQQPKGTTEFGPSNKNKSNKNKNKSNKNKNKSNKNISKSNKNISKSNKNKSNDIFNKIKSIFY